MTSEQVGMYSVSALGRGTMTSGQSELNARRLSQQNATVGKRRIILWSLFCQSLVNSVNMCAGP